MALNVYATSVLSGLINGVLYGSLLGVVAVGLTLIWGVMKVVNLAHGHVVVFAAMISAYLITVHGFNPLYALAVAAAVSVPLGAALYYATLHKIIGRVDTITLKEEMATLMTTFGAGLILYGSHYAVNVLVTSEYSTEPSIYWAPWKPPSFMVLGVVVEKIRILVAGISVVIAVLAHLFLTRTSLGLYIRAVAQDSRALALSGVDPVRVKLLTTIVATVLAAVAGSLYLIYTKSVTPDSEAEIAPLAFIVVVLGGLGSVLGSFLGGVILGVVYQVIFSVTGVQALALAAAFIILIIMLVVRPQGIFGGRL